MKKLLLLFGSLAIILAGMFSCRKNETRVQANSNKEKTNLDAILIPDINQGGSNYCNPCGTSNSHLYACIYDPQLERTICDLVEKPICGMKALESFAENNNLTYNLDSNAAYEARDSFLAFSPIGQKYITYYQAISAVFYENTAALNLSNYYQHYQFAANVQSAADIIMYGDSNDIPITTALKSDGITLINYYKTVDSSAYFNSVLDSLENDLNLYVGKTRSQMMPILFP